MTMLAMASLIFLAVGDPSAAQSLDSQISEAEINALLRAAVRQDAPRAMSLPHFEFIGMGQDSYYPRFQMFQAIWEGLPEGSVNIGFYAVDPLTADVWSGTYCNEFSSRRLRLLQRKLRARIHLSDEQYRKIKVTGPECDG